MWKVEIILLLFHVLLLGITQPSLGNDQENSGTCSKPDERIVEKKAGDYRVRISYSDDRMCQHLEIFKKDRLVHKEEGFDNHYTLGNDWGNRHDPYLMNLTGHGTQLVVKNWTGGAHCCNSLLIFDVRGEFRKIDEIYGGSFDFEIIDLNHNGIPEIRLTDDFLAYLFSSFADSAKATVILKYANGHYSVAAELMRKPARLKWLNAKLPKWRKLLREHHDPNWPPPPLIQAMTDLIFTGNENLAFQLVDKVWSQDISGKDAFLKSYREALADSKYYSELKFSDLVMEPSREHAHRPAIRVVGGMIHKQVVESRAKVREWGPKIVGF